MYKVGDGVQVKVSERVPECFWGNVGEVIDTIACSDNPKNITYLVKLDDYGGPVAVKAHMLRLF